MHACISFLLSKNALLCMFYGFFFLLHALSHSYMWRPLFPEVQNVKKPYQRCFPFFLQLAKMNVEAQRVERDLRDELANSISKAASDADRSRIAELEKVEAELRVEVSRHV